MIFLPPVLLLYCVAIMFGIIQWMAAEKAQLAIAAEQANTRLRMMDAQYAYMEGNQSQVRQLRHDMLHHVRVVTGLLAEKQTEAAQEYLNRIGEMVTAPTCAS